MSFSSKVKEELSRQLSPARHCQIAEIAAILSLCGRIQISENNRYRVKIHTENEAVARKYFTLLKKTFNIRIDVSIRQGIGNHKNRTCTVAVTHHEDAMRVLQAVKLIDPYGEIEENLSLAQNVVLMQNCCKRAYGGHFWQQVPSAIRKSFTILRLPARPKQRQSRFRASSFPWESKPRSCCGRNISWFTSKREARSLIS